MKIAILLLMCVTAAGLTASTDLARTAPLVSDGPGTDATITVTVLHTFTVPYASEVLDLGWLSSGYLLFTSIMDHSIFACDPSTGSFVDELAAYSYNPYPWGVTYGPSGSVLTTNDYTYSSLFSWSGSDWSQVSNPAGIYGRGIEYDGSAGVMWEATTTPTGRYLYRFVPGGSPTFYSLSQPSSFLTGVAVFPLGSGLGVILTSYTDLNFYVYQYIGTSLTYVGHTVCPSSPYPPQYSLGLTYSPQRSTFFWSYKDATGSKICELSVTVDLALQPETWGSIKALF